MKGIRWGIVTFTSCISTGTLGHYLPVEVVFVAVTVVSLLAAGLGALTISEDKP